jgi:hypothetical protein
MLGQITVVVMEDRLWAAGLSNLMIHANRVGSHGQGGS